MSSPSQVERVPSLDDILARLAELAPAEADRDPASRPEPDVQPRGEGVVIDLDTLAETTPTRLAVVGGGERTAVATPATDVEIDLRVRAPAVEPEAPAQLDPAAAPEPEPAAQPEAITSAPPAGIDQGGTSAPPTEIDQGGDRFDLRPDEPEPTPSAAATTTLRHHRSHNPFRRLIVWSIVIGVVLIVIAGVLVMS